jgi:Ca2+:H+ antiporter
MAVADALSSLMIISAVALILPTALYSTFEASTPLDLDKQIVNFSRGTAVVLFVLYIAYLYFQLKTHKYLFDAQPEGNTAHRGDESNAVSRQGSHQGTDHEGTQRTPVEDLEQTAPTNVLTTTVALIASAAGIMLCSYFLLASIDKTSEATHISRTFIAAILVPIASNAPECATVIAAARSGRIDYALGVIVGSILQIALCVIPILVMLGWVLHQPMTLSFEVFQTIILFLAILLVNHLLQNGKYTYMHGLVLVGLYVSASSSVSYEKAANNWVQVRRARHRLLFAR